jgi:hypothetical protein
LLLYSSHLPLGVPNGLDIQLGTNSFLVPSSQQSSSFLAPLPGTKEEYFQRKKKKLPRQLHASTMKLHIQKYLPLVFVIRICGCKIFIVGAVGDLKGG